MKLATFAAIVAVLATLSFASAEEASIDAAGAAFGSLNPPHGGVLVDVMASPERAEELLTSVAPHLPSLTLTPRQLCDIEMLMNGGFSPLRGFMDSTTYRSVLETMRLPSGEVWPMPITLDVPESASAARAAIGDQFALRDQFFNLIAILNVTDVFSPNKLTEAELVLGTTDPSHPAANYLFNKAGNVYIGGSLEGVRLPQHFDFTNLRFTPKQLRERLTEMKWSRFVAFQTRNPMHRAHIELTSRAAKSIQGHVLIHPVVGMTKPGDVDYATRVRCYQAVLKNAERYYGKDGAFLSLLPLAMRMAGPREALWHSIIRKNHGASHFIIGRDHAGCKSASGKDFYGPYDAQELVAKYADEIGIQVVPFKMLVYLPNSDTYMPVDEVPEDVEHLAISGTKFRKMMAQGDTIPAWFSDPDIINILREVNPPKAKRGFTVFFSGLSGSGKTTISSALVERLTAANPARPISVLDGDVVRTHLSAGLGFTTKDRNTNIARIGWVASEVVRHRGISIAAPIAPFEYSRQIARRLVSSANGAFVMVHVATSLEVCQERDVKGLYAKALEGKIRQFTGYSHPYEMPSAAELTIDAGVVPVEDSVDYILGYLTREGYLDEQESLEKLNAHPEVVTAGLKDAASSLCPNLGKPPVVFATSPLASSLPALRTQLEGIGAATFALTDEAFNTAGGAQTPFHSAGNAVRRHQAEQVLTDDSPNAGAESIKEAEAVNVAWAAYVRATGAAHENEGKPVVVTSPRLAFYLPNILRFNPCVKAVVVTGYDEQQVVAALTSAGVPEAAAKEYVAQYSQKVASLVVEFPKRVMEVPISELVQ